MSFIQLISNNTESAYFSTNFSDIITIKPNSRIALIDVQVNRDARLDFTADIEANRKYTFTVNWGAVDTAVPDKSQGGMSFSYILDPANLPQPYNDVTYIDLLTELDSIIRNGGFQNYKLDFTLSETHGGKFLKIHSRWAYDNFTWDGMVWNIIDTAGWVNTEQDDTPEPLPIQDASSIVSLGGTLNPDGNFIHNYIISKQYIAIGGTFGARFYKGRSMVIGLSFIDSDEFTNDFFSTTDQGAEYWKLDGTIWYDRVSTLYYRIDTSTNGVDDYLLIELAGGTQFGELEVTNIQPNGCNITITNDDNEDGVEGIMYAGDFGISKCELVNGGTGYITGIYDVEAFETGEQAKIEVLTVDGTGQILTFRINDEGQGYTINTHFRLIGGNSDCDFIIVEINTFLIKWDDLDPSDITLYFQPDHVSNVNFPSYFYGLPDIPIGVHLNCDDDNDNIQYTIFRHKYEAFGGYDPYDRENIQILLNGKLNSKICDVVFSIGLNQIIDIEIRDPTGTNSLKKSYFIDKRIVQEKAQLYGVLLSDCQQNQAQIIEYDRPNNPTDETFTWSGDEFNEFRDSRFIQITFDMTGGLDRILGIDTNNIIQSGRYREDFLIGSNPITTQGEGKRYNICIDNLNMKSYKNFSNDYTTNTGFISGVADRMIGSMPTYIQGLNYGILYFQPNPIYIDLNNPTEKRINQLTVSFRDVETNKIVTDLYGTSIVTIHITN